MDFYYIDIVGIVDSILGVLLGTDTLTYSRLEYLFFWWGLVSMVFSIMAILAITYLLIKINEVVAEEKAIYAPALQEVETQPVVNENWQRVLSYLGSSNPSDWKLAIIEADTMLDEMLKRMGMSGESLGERLKAVDPADFDTLDQAWEAHKIRNQIAHQTGFIMTQREVRRIIDLYERVFTEFSFI